MPKKRAWGQHFLNEGKSYKAMPYREKDGDKKKMRDFGRKFKNV